MYSERTGMMWRFLRAYTVEAVIEVPPGLKCASCRDILADARQTPCGCRFCSDCVVRVFSDGARPCPGGTEDCADDQLLDLAKDIIVDNYANREIGRLVVKCPHNDCRNTEELRKMCEHVTDCEYKEVTCEKCNQCYKKRDKHIHESKECDMREVKCNFCKESVTNFELQNVHHNIRHERLCEKYQSNCPYSCGVRQVVLIKQHLVICNNRPQACPFSALGCTLVHVPSQEMNDHLLSEGHGHAKSLVSYIENLNNEITSLKLKNVAQARFIDQFKNDQPLKDLTFERRHNDFVWKVEGFSMLLNKIKEGKKRFVESKSFLSDRYGYKMCLKLYPNGDGEAEGRYISLYFVFLTGKYDDILPWPFSGTVTLKLVNCNGFQDDYIKKGVFKNLSRDSHVGAGCINFFEISKLSEVSGFLKHDNIYIKCSID